MIGWVDGFWYNESLNIDESDGELTQEELANLTARTAARVEALRCLTFEELPPVQTLTRAEWRDRIESGYDDEFNESDRLFARAQLATMFFAGQNQDTVEVLIEHRTGFPIAFYDTQDRFMGFISNDPNRIEVDETVLAHELTHALQDQHFEIGSIFLEPTNDQFMSSLAIIEGDAVLVGELYEENCGTWVGDCILVESDSGDPPENWGLTLESLAPYNAQLVAHTYNTDGWTGVNTLIEEPPDSMLEVLQPTMHGDFEREHLVVFDRNDDRWHRVSTQSASHDVVGQHGLTAMLIAPSIESQIQVVDPQPFFESHPGGSFDYNHPVTRGWRSDIFYAYATEDGDTGSVWLLSWASAIQANDFADAYEDLIEYRGGEPVDGFDNVYSFESSTTYDMAVGIQQDDDRVLIVTAPTPEELHEVHSRFDSAPLDETDPIERIESLESEIDELEAQLEDRDRRIESLESELEDQRAFRDRVNDLIEDEELENIEEVIQLLEESRQEDPEDNVGEEDDGSPGFGVYLALAALIGAAALLKKRMR